MTTKETGNVSGRDTRMCGDPKMWFPMRVTYQREIEGVASVAIAYVPVGMLREIG